MSDILKWGWGKPSLIIFYFQTKKIQDRFQGVLNPLKLHIKFFMYTCVFFFWKESTGDPWPNVGVRGTEPLAVKNLHVIHVCPVSYRDPSACCSTSSDSINHKPCNTVEFTVEKSLRESRPTVQTVVQGPTVYTFRLLKESAMVQNHQAWMVPNHCTIKAIFIPSAPPPESSEACLNNEHSCNNLFSRFIN